jgi:hypothetical protein
MLDAPRPAVDAQQPTLPPPTQPRELLRRIAPPGRGNAPPRARDGVGEGGELNWRRPARSTKGSRGSQSRPPAPRQAAAIKPNLTPPPSIPAPTRLFRPSSRAGPRLCRSLGGAAAGRHGGSASAPEAFSAAWSVDRPDRLRPLGSAAWGGHRAFGSGACWRRRGAARDGHRHSRTGGTPTRDALRAHERKLLAVFVACTTAETYCMPAKVLQSRR